MGDEGYRYAREKVKIMRYIVHEEAARGYDKSAKRTGIRQNIENRP